MNRRTVKELQRFDSPAVLHSIVIRAVFEDAMAFIPIS
jgi:hypothetical protein